MEKSNLTVEELEDFIENIYYNHEKDNTRDFNFITGKGGFINMEIELKLGMLGAIAPVSDKDKERITKETKEKYKNYPDGAYQFSLTGGWTYYKGI